MSSLKEQLLKLLKQKKEIKKSKLTPSSGKKHNFFIDIKQITLDPRGAYLTARIILKKIKGLSVDAIGGPTLGADPIASAVSVISSQTRHPIPAFIVRKKSKEHGLQKEIEGIIQPGWRVLIVEDVVDTGTSAKLAIQAVKKIGCKVVKVICLVNRKKKAAEILKNYNFEPIFNLSDLLE